MKKVIIFVITFLVVGLIIFTSIFILRSTQKEEQIVEDEHSKLYIPGVSVEDVSFIF